MFWSLFYFNFITHVIFWVKLTADFRIIFLIFKCIRATHQTTEICKKSSVSCTTLITLFSRSTIEYLGHPCRKTNPTVDYK
jgi:hypothetical protein